MQCTLWQNGWARKCISIWPRWLSLFLIFTIIDNDAIQDVVCGKYIKCTAQGTRILGLSGCFEVPLILGCSHVHMHPASPRRIFAKSLPFPSVSARNTFDHVGFLLLRSDSSYHNSGKTAATDIASVEIYPFPELAPTYKHPTLPQN